MSEAIGGPAAVARTESAIGLLASCGQLCGKHARHRALAERMRRRGVAAEISSTAKRLQINGLHEDVGFVTASASVLALRGAAVEFQARVVAGAARG